MSLTTDKLGISPLIGSGIWIPALASYKPSKDIPVLNLYPTLYMVAKLNPITRYIYGEAVSPPK